MTSSNLNVLIAGGGICGLSCAVALRRSGHNVRVLERSQFSNEVGAAITLSPPTTRILRSWDLDFQKAQMVDLQTMEVVIGDGDSILSRNQRDYHRAAKTSGNPYLLSHRVDLHEALRDIATSPRGLGKPAKIINGARIVSLDAEAGRVELEDGSRLEGDLVIAADGLHSKASQYIGDERPAIASDTTVVRYLVPTSRMLDDPATKDMIPGDGVTSLYYSSSHRNRWLLRYPCRNNQLQNIAFYSIDSSPPSESRQLTFQCDRESLLQAFDGFPSYVLATALKAQEVLPLWRCAYREPLPRMYRGRLVLVGDAAHAMLPHLGQGAAQSIEDAAALGTLFQDLTFEGSDQTKDIIKSRLALFERARKDRVTGVQILSSVPIGDKDYERARMEWEKYLPGYKFPCQKADGINFCNSYDVVKECLALLKHSP